MTYYEKLRESWSRSSSLICVGLDPDLKKLPESVRGKKRPIFEFNRAIIDATAESVCAFKLQYAYYGAQRAEADLEDTVSYIRENYPRTPVILDAKRCDFDVSAEQYAIEAFDRYKVDALTVVPFQGFDSLRPYLERREKGVIVLCKTSNPGGSEIQDLDVNGEALYMMVARRAALEWNYNGNVSLVVGGTFPEQIKEIRAVVGEIPLLVPGFGAQRGSLAESVRAGTTNLGTGLVLSASRSIIYASEDEDFAFAAKAAVRRMNEEVVSAFKHSA